MAARTLVRKDQRYVILVFVGLCPNTGIQIGHIEIRVEDKLVGAYLKALASQIINKKKILDWTKIEPVAAQNVISSRSFCSVTNRRLTGQQA